ncbi:TRAP transporter small permease [Pseudogemmobacter sonorensis]|uniref:TRAP transporter small permease n=1 Tax=Pseudogemmobacter sonorensis TaxID=2989681 RepID=UPI0036BB0F8A
MKYIGRLLAKASDGAGALAGLILVMMILHITFDVVMRSFLNMPINGTVLIVSLFYMPAIVFLPLAMSERMNTHISVEILYDYLPRRARLVLDVLGNLLSIVILSALAWRAWLEAAKKFQIGAAEIEGGLRIATWPSYFLLPFGCALMATVLLWKTGMIVTDRPLEGVSEHSKGPGHD